MNSTTIRTLRRRFAGHGGRWRQAQRQGRRGTAIVEFSLVLPVLLILIFGVFEFALAVHTQVDYGNAVSNGVREATIDTNKYLNDDLIASKLFQTMRQDDPDRANYYDIELVSGRVYTDTTNLYDNVYGYDTTNHAFNELPFYNVPTSTFGFSSLPAADYCNYFYQTHLGSDGNVYLDANNAIKLGTLGDSSTADTNAQQIFSQTAFSQSVLNQLVSSSCVQASGSHRDATGGTLVLTCNANGKNYSFMTALGFSGHLCYYYPNGRISDIDTAGVSGLSTLPDLIQVDVNYTYKPLGSYVSAHSPLGIGFTINEHARGRLEPTIKNQ